MRGAIDTRLIRPGCAAAAVPDAARLMRGFPFDLVVQVRQGVHRSQPFFGKPPVQNNLV